MRPILLFDIDGTLLRIDKDFMESLLLDILNGLELDIKNYKDTSFAGRTDRSIFRSLLGSQKDDDELFEELKSSYISKMQNQLFASDITVFKHVRECLVFFADQNYRMGLLTGNFKEIADHKLKLLDLHAHFTFGAFGCNHTDRNMLGKAALESYKLIHRDIPDSEQFIIIGDTPLDIRCAKHSGYKSIAVTTGNYSGEELATYQPDLILESLRNPQAWIYEL